MSISSIASVPSEASEASDPQIITGEVETAKSPELKGFADIVEYHRKGAGRDVQIVPTEEWAPNTGKKADDEQPSEYDDYAIVLRRVWVRKRKTLSLSRLELEIRSETLCDAFRKAAVDCYEFTNLQSTPIKLNSPFKELFFYRNEIKALSEDQAVDSKLRREAGWLHDFIKTNGLMKSIVHDYEKYTKVGKIPTEILWTVFPPNSLLSVRAGEVKECWICRNVAITESSVGYSWTVTGFRIGFNGVKPGIVRKIHTLPLHSKSMSKISELPVVPIEHCPDWADRKGKLLARAANLQRLLGQTFTDFASQTYNGPSWQHDFTYYAQFDNAYVTAKQMDERIMIDCTAYMRRCAMPPIMLESLREKSTANRKRTTAKPRGIVLEKKEPPVYAPPPRAAPGPPGRAGPPPRSQGLPPPPGVPAPYIPPPPGWNAESVTDSEYVDSDCDSSSESDWSDIDGAEFDPDGNAGLMEFKTFGSSAEPGDMPEPDGHDLDALAKAVKKAFHLPTEDFGLLFPAIVPAFGLKEKEWRWVLSDLLQDVKWNTTAFESLQLEGGTKDLIQSLVKGYRSQASFDDVVPGKGQGLIFLLHGKPGLGKTLTAESVADHLERPLYSIQAGELSTEAGLLERKLNEIFYLTRRWDAVSLLDEADVLLCKRKSSEMDRNAVVAVFLRKIEYFQGVLFLTTNRREDFDDAFKSRIHLTISYHDLSEQAQSAIWKKLIATNQDVRVDDSWVDAAYEDLGKLSLNGRTIRNFLRTAVSYADARDEPLGVRHVLEIIRTELKADGLEGVFSTAPGEHRKRARADEALGDLQRLAEQPAI